MTEAAGTLHPIVSLLIAYIFGSIPSAYLAGKAKGVDLRQHGSGNLGATNVVRVLGPKIGAAVFTVDILKGFLPVMFLPGMTATSHQLAFSLAVGIVAILGHIRPIFLLTKGGGGGKGVATAAGVFLGLALIPMVITLAVWIIVFAIWRYVSLASLVAAATLPIAMLLSGFQMTNPVLILAIAIAIFIFFTHKSNIDRLKRGQEYRFGKSGERSK